MWSVLVWSSQIAWGPRGGHSLKYPLISPLFATEKNVSWQTEYIEAKEKYRGVFEIQKSGDKTSSGEIGLGIRTHASPKVGQDQVSGGVSVLCWHAAPVAYVLWKPCTIGKKSNSVIRSRSVMVKIGVMSYQWRVSLYVVIIQNVV